MLVKDIIDNIITHNEIIAIWTFDRSEWCHYRQWRGMAWDLQDKRPDLFNSKFVKIFGVIPESIVEADTINIEIEESCS